MHSLEELINAVLKERSFRETSFVWKQKLSKQKGPVGIGEAIATVDGKVAVKAELTFMIG